MKYDEKTNTTTTELEDLSKEDLRAVSALLAENITRRKAEGKDATDVEARQVKALAAVSVREARK